MSGLQTILRRDLMLAMRRRGDVLTVLFFFVIVASLFPLGVGPDPKLLRLMGGGVVWVSALLAAMLSLGRMFASDHADGTLEQLVKQLSRLTMPCCVPRRVGETKYVCGTCGWVTDCHGRRIFDLVSVSYRFEPGRQSACPMSCSGRLR